MDNKFIALSVPNLKGNELKYVTDAVETEWVSSGGSYINAFEETFAQFVKVDDAVAVQSGTAALHLALMEVGVEYGEEVLAPTLTFIAAVNPIRYCGAEPVFFDCDDSLCLDPIKLDQFLEQECTYEDGIVRNKATNKRIRAIVVVHVFGNMADMASIMPIAHKYQLKVIEDATEALGTTYTEGVYSGKLAGTIADIGAYSFNGNKIMTTGGGGMLVSNNKQYLDHMRYLSTQAKDDLINFVHGEVGYNYRMTNLQGALGLGQIEQLSTFIETKERNYRLYSELLRECQQCSILPFREGTKPNFWFYSLYLSSEENIQVKMDALQLKRIQTRPIWGLMHEQKPYLKNQSYQIEKAEHYAKHIINIPCSTNLLEEDVRYVAQSIKKIFGE